MIPFESWEAHWLFDDAVKLKSPYLIQSVVFILPALTPYLQIGPVTIIATTKYSVQERPICCIGPYSRASLKPNLMNNPLSAMRGYCMHAIMPSCRNGVCVCANNSTQVDCSTKWLAPLHSPRNSASTCIFMQ